MAFKNTNITKPSYNKKIIREFKRVIRQISDLTTFREGFQYLPYSRSWTEVIESFCVYYFPIFRNYTLRKRYSVEGKSFPCVSIIIPVFNHFDQTARCLLSLSQLRTAIEFEIIVVDDGSSDDTEAILKELYGIRYIRNDTNSGFIDSCMFNF